jgi:hypothetical protein
VVELCGDLPLVGGRIAFVGGRIAPVGGRVTIVGGPVPKISQPLALVRREVSPVQRFEHLTKHEPQLSGFDIAFVAQFVALRGRTAASLQFEIALIGQRVTFIGGQFARRESSLTPVGGAFPSGEVTLCLLRRRVRPTWHIADGRPPAASDGSDQCGRRSLLAVSAGVRVGACC